MRKRRGILRSGSATIGVLCMVVVPSLAATEESPARSWDPNVSVRRVRQADHIDLVVENHKLYAVTLRLSITPSNVTVLRLQPETAVYPPHSQMVAAQVSTADPTRPSSLRCHWDWTKGDMQARHDDRVVYALPFERGTSHRVAQGYDGPWSHKDADRYAVDFAMPEGTLVCAARDGVVVDLRESSEDGGIEEKDKRRSNFVSILHDDGTIAEYLHLQHRGLLVKIGQRVTAGTPIARSGNTGYSSRPHLHFGVYSAVDGTHIESHPVTFAARQGTITDPVAGRIYTAR